MATELEITRLVKRLAQTFTLTEVKENTENWMVVLGGLTTEQLDAGYKECLFKHKPNEQGFMPRLVPGEFYDYATITVPFKARGIEPNEWIFTKDDQGREYARRRKP